MQPQSACKSSFDRNSSIVDRRSRTSEIIDTINTSIEMFQIKIADIHTPKMEFLVCKEFLDVIEITCTKIIYYNNLVPFFHQFFYHVGTEKSCPTCYQIFTHYVPFYLKLK